MKTTFALTLAAMMFLVCGLTAVSAKDAPAVQSHNLPVLVKVNAKGKVTDVTPAFKVRPSFQRLLGDTIRKMITKPAMKKGKAVSSQLVITLAVLTSKGADGKTATTLKYLTAKPLPPGVWTWARDDQGRLALTSQSTQDNIKIPLTPMERKANAINAAAAASRYRPGTGPGGR